MRQVIPLLEETKNGRDIDKVSQQPTWYHSGVHSTWMTHEKLCYPEGEEKFTQFCPLKLTEKYNAQVLIIA